MKHAVVAIGAANVDIQGFTEQSLRMRDSNPGRIEICLGGVSRNISENLVRLGVDTILLTAIGDDLFGRQILSDCSRMGIDLSHSMKVKEARSSTYMAVMDETGDMALALSDMSILDQLTTGYLSEKRELLENAQIIVMDAGLTPEVMAWLVKHFPGKRMILDPVSTGKCRRMKSFAGDFYCIKMNRMEAGFLADSTIDNHQDLTRAADRLLHRGVKKLFITLGREGVYYRGPDEEGLANAPVLKTVNATGAGDAFTAAVVYGELQNWSMADTARFAVGAASVALMSRHTVSGEMSPSEVNKWMKQSGKRGENQ